MGELPSRSSDVLDEKSVGPPGFAQSEKRHQKLVGKESCSTGAELSDSGTSGKSDKMEFKRRLFVQYLWKNVKANDKARVQKEVP